MADRDKVDPADEPDTSATPGEPEDPAPDVDDAAGDEPEGDQSQDDDDRELVPAGRASRSSKGSETEVAGSGGRVKKDKATPKQKRDAVEHQRTGPVMFVKQSVAELRKVVYPTGPQLANYFVVVLIFVLFIIAYVSLLDLGIGAAVFRIFA
ncbi:MAG TPA: preprotein translocase subunit SecE [Microlunatus sp.]